jgi:hypothetical protein
MTHYLARVLVAKLHRRVLAPFRKYQRTFAAVLRRQAVRDVPAAVAELQKRPMDRAQWRRWYKADQVHKRRLRAMRRAGLRHIPGPVWNVRREVIL